MICGMPGPTDGDDHDQHDQVGKALPSVDEALGYEIDFATKVASDDADHDGDEGSKAGGAQADDDGELCAVETAREHVPAQVVGAERERPRRRL